jgi:aminomethyltransferase
MERIQHTVFYQSHINAGAKMVDFAGWQMPIQYPDGIVTEHLSTRKHAGLFDVSHMGRFLVCGPGASAFLRHVLTNDCEKLAVGQAQYTILANETGGAIDDAFLYKTAPTDYLLVVNASNANKDFDYLCSFLTEFRGVEFVDVSGAMAMLALQGPQSEVILQSLVTEGNLSDSMRNAVASLKIGDIEVTVARTGYTGEPVCFELFIGGGFASAVWNKLTSAGAKPVGLGARDTLRLEAGLPLYGHELGTDPDGGQIPIYAIGQAPFAVSFEDKGRAFVGRDALERQAAAKQRYKAGDFSDSAALPKVVRQVRLIDKGIAREGSKVYDAGQPVGWVSSGTMVPYWVCEAAGDGVKFKDEQSRRAIGLCLIDPQVSLGSEIEIEVRGRMLKAKIVARNLENRKVKRTFAL